MGVAPKERGTKHRVLILTSRGVTASHRNFVSDIKTLIPHHKGESKLDTKKDLSGLVEMADMASCDKIVYFESRKHRDLYVYVSDAAGPSVKMSVHNIKTMEELNLTGNFLKGSRPILSFDQTFNKQPQHRVIKELLKQCFATPEYHPKSKPFMDHTISFSLVGDLITMRVYQITDVEQGRKAAEVELIEVGPRCVMRVEKVFAGPFSGKVLYSPAPM